MDLKWTSNEPLWGPHGKPPCHGSYLAPLLTLQPKYNIIYYNIIYYNNNLYMCHVDSERNCGT